MHTRSVRNAHDQPTWMAAHALALTLAMLATPSLVAQPQTIRGAQTIETSTPDVFDADLRRMAREAVWIPGDPVREIPRRFYPRDGLPAETATPRSSAAPDPLLDVQASAPVRESVVRAFSQPSRNFTGQGFSGVNPPDTVGDVGTNFFVQMINGSGGATLTIYNKADGVLEAGPMALDSLGSGNCSTGKGDPIVLFDAEAHRWFLSEFSNIGNRLCIYISRTADPVTGGWFNYSFEAPNFPDYPKYGVWPDAYYASTNESSGPAVYAFERSAMLAGDPATLQRFSAPALQGFGFQALTPADLDGPNAPPASAPNYMVRHRDDERHNAGSNNPQQDFLEVWEFRADFADPSNASFTGPFNIAITEFDSGLCGFTSFSCFDQPGSSVRLDPLREVVMRRVQYRNFGDRETLVGNMVTDVDGSDRGGIRWWQLQKNGDGPWTLAQEGTYSPDANNRFMASVALDGDGNLAMGYNVVGATVFPSLRFAGRLASDPLGAITHGELPLIDGSASNASERYGDYSSLSIDPVDDCTFWFTGQFSPASRWATRVGAFSFTECVTTNQFNLGACQAFCESLRDTCPALPGMEAVCSPLFESCQQLCTDSAER